MRKVFIRADGNSEIGLGHVIRCCALAQMLRNKFDCTFFVRHPSEYLKQEIQNAGSKLIEIHTREHEGEIDDFFKFLTGAEIVVLDGYHFKTYYQQMVKNTGCKLVSVDDIHDNYFLSDVVINHGGGIRPADYDAEFCTQFFLGPKFSLLRKEFIYVEGNDKDNDSLLISLGGADPLNDTLRVLKRIPVQRFKNIKILIGAGYNFRSELESYLQTCPVDCTVYQNINALQVARLMQSCGIAVLSPSSISYEYISGTGLVYLYQIADNQKHIKEYLLNEGLAYDFSDLEKNNQKDPEGLINKQGKIFDQKSPLRIQNIFENLAFMSKTVLRKINKEDLLLTHKWANDTLSRQMSYTTNEISLDEHRSWFENKLEEKTSQYYIFEISGHPFAQIRFDHRKDSFLISYFIDEPYRGKGLGSFVLAEGLKELKKNISCSATVVGYVKEENTASCISFEKMNFHREPAEDYKKSFKYILHIKYDNNYRE